MGHLFAGQLQPLVLRGQPGKETMHRRHVPVPWGHNATPPIVTLPLSRTLGEHILRSPPPPVSCTAKQQVRSAPSPSPPPAPSSLPQRCTVAAAAPCLLVRLGWGLGPVGLLGALLALVRALVLLILHSGALGPGPAPGEDG